jgi:meso-butanediol dehydrogenase/(S,S)-butanediol dehydrogenase/diacetyl reductase
MSLRLEGKVAVVTGGGSGFGRATAIRFAREGARVVVADVDATGAAETVDRIGAIGGEGEVVVADISELSGAHRAVDHAVRRFGPVTTLVNNAGIAQSEPRETWDTDEGAWDRVVQVNLRSVYACSRAAIPAMLEAGGGTIVSVASIAASVCVGGAAYAASKGAVLSYTRHVARELAGRGVRANCVSPGFMHTPMTTGERSGLSAEEQDARLASFARRVPMHSVGTADDIANAILFLSSDESAYITGQELVVDGGYLVR